MNKDETTEKLKRLVARCKECKFATCENCEINWNEVQAIETILDLYNKEKEDNKLYKLCMIQDQDFRDRLIEILGVGDNEETILQYIATLVSEKKGIDELIREKQDLKTELYINSVSKDKIREYRKQFIKDNKKEKTFMTQSSQINASLIKFCEALLLEEE
jgi:hypothetical protein